MKVRNLHVRGVWLLLIAIFVALTTSISAQVFFFAGTGNYYEYVSGQMSWDAAVVEAETHSHMSVSGHLVTITSSEENEFLNVTFASGLPEFFAWIGGYEPNDDGVWLWGVGPEVGVQFSNGATPTPPYYYANWQGVEPNDYNPGEDFAAINLGFEFASIPPGGWADSPNPNPTDPIRGLIVEYETGTSAPDYPEVLEYSVCLKQIYPNPFNALTRIELSIAIPSRVYLRIYDIKGRLVRTIIDDHLGAGVYSELWNGRNNSGSQVASGIYYCRLEVGDFAQNRKVMLLR